MDRVIRRDGRNGRRLWRPNPVALKALAGNELCRALERYLPQRIVVELKSISPPSKLGESLDPWRDWANRRNIGAKRVAEWAQHVTYEWHRTGLQPTQYMGGYDLGTIRAMPYMRRPCPQPEPQKESRNEYLERAGEEWDVRAEQLRQKGFEPFPPIPALSKQCDWVIRHRALRVSHEQLATEDRGGVDSISKGILKIETILEFPPSKK
jgi:hypothetical protein